MATVLQVYFENENYTIDNVNISSYEWRPIYAEDGFTLIRYEIHVSGSGLIADGLDTYGKLQNFNIGAVGRADYVGLFVVTPESYEYLFEVRYPDALRGPLVTINVTEISGVRAAICNFTVMAAIAYPGEIGAVDVPYPITSHRWTSRFSLDAAGHITRTVSGTLVVNLGGNGNRTQRSS